MMTLSLIVALVALAVSLAAIWMASRGPGTGGPLRAPPPPPINYSITGNIKVTNECDGLQASIPARVTINSDLSNAAGNVKVPGSTTINLAPDPANPGAAVKIGTYTINAAWPNAGGAPAHWTRPDVLDLPNGNPICSVIPGCTVPRVCRDMSTATRTVPFVNPVTNHDIRVECTCADP